MSEPEESTDFQLEWLVRGHLDRAAEQFDPRPLFSRLTSNRPDSKTRSAPLIARRRPARAIWRIVGLASAASLLVAAAASFLRERPVQAKGATVVQEARQAHSIPVDRCYLVEVRRESPVAAELAPNSPQVRLTRLWTRGDRFWVESARADQRWAWGRDKEDRFWIAFGPHTAVRMGADEVPPWLNLYCDLHSLNVERWLGEVLDRFDLTRETDSSESDSLTIRITAKARAFEIPPPVPSIDRAEIEVDAQTRVIRRMVVRRVWKGEPFATVTYSLLETDALDPTDYQVEGHLSDPSEIFTRDHEPQRRKELLARWFGGRPGRTLQGLERPKSPEIPDPERTSR